MAAFHSSSRLFILGSLILISLIAATCTGIQLRTGEHPDANVLEKNLKFGESTPADVLRILGAPFGTGRVMFPTDSRPKTLWSYYYEESTMEESRRIFLFVTFDENQYDGYMWFSSLPSGPTFPK
jgi:hypothetical protein